MTDALELRVLRAAFGESHAEFDRPGGKGHTGWQDDAKRRWEKFLRRVMDDLLVRWPDADALLERFVAWGGALSALDLSPNFFHLWAESPETHPQTALAVADALLGGAEHRLLEHFDLLVLAATRGRPEERLAICQRALDSGREPAVTGAIKCLEWWRRQEGPLPVGAWAPRRLAAVGATPNVAL